jgi:hypothetical protein
MAQTRTVTASDAKGSLGQLLGSLATQGAVEITRNGHLVGVLTAPPQRARTADPDRMAALAPPYAAGKLGWREIADDTGAAFGELLLELARQGLTLPQVSAEKRPAQAAHLRAIFKQAARR